MMNLITMHQLHRSQLGIGKGGGFMDIEKSVAVFWLMHRQQRAAMV
ncbi:hypothetical protein INQ74_26910 [Klebsiella pneumoniae]|nr:hypothetical protein [Klebsiella pneumoniae]